MSGPKITFQPIDQTVVGSEGESLLDVALNHDVPMQHACGGFCACATCHIRVLEGAENLSPMEPDEEDRVQTADRFDAKTSRLACQCRLIKGGQLKVEIMNLDH